MLTDVEAGEEYLQGEPYVSCAQCNGTGRRTEWVGHTASAVSCQYCESGMTPRPPFQQACQKLGIPMPTVRQVREGNWRNPAFITGTVTS